jgi:hypothetical protein
MDLCQVAARLPAIGSGAAGRFFQQRLQALLGGGVALIIEFVQFQRLHDGGDVHLGGGHFRFAGTGKQLGHDQRGQHAHDHHDHHDFDQGEATGGASGKR